MSIKYPWQNQGTCGWQVTNNTILFNVISFKYVFSLKQLVNKNGIVSLKKPAHGDTMDAKGLEVCGFR